MHTLQNLPQKLTLLSHQPWCGPGLNIFHVWATAAISDWPLVQQSKTSVLLPWDREKSTRGDGGKDEVLRTPEENASWHQHWGGGNSAFQSGNPPHFYVERDFQPTSEDLHGRSRHLGWLVVQLHNLFWVKSCLSRTSTHRTAPVLSSEMTQRQSDSSSMWGFFRDQPPDWAPELWAFEDGWNHGSCPEVTVGEKEHTLRTWLKVLKFIVWLPGSVPPGRKLGVTEDNSRDHAAGSRKPAPQHFDHGWKLYMVSA